jgi:hypothetical protein
VDQGEWNNCTRVLVTLGIPFVRLRGNMKRYMPHDQSLIEENRQEDEQGNQRDESAQIGSRR